MNFGVKEQKKIIKYFSCDEVKLKLQQEADKHKDFNLDTFYERSNMLLNLEQMLATVNSNQEKKIEQFTIENNTTSDFIIPSSTPPTQSSTADSNETIMKNNSKSPKARTKMRPPPFLNLIALNISAPPNSAIPSAQSSSMQQCNNAEHAPPVRGTVTQVLREEARIKKKVERSEQVLKDISHGSTDPYKITSMLRVLRTEQYEAELQEIERKHLLGRISQEEAKLAKLAVQKEKQIMVTKLKKQKQELEQQLAEYRRQEEIRMKDLAEKSQTSLIMAKQAQTDLLNHKRKTVKEVQNESREIQRQIFLRRQEELDHKINLIRQIKELEQATRALNREPSCRNVEMDLSRSISIKELRIALAKMKEQVQNEIEKRRKKVQEEKQRQRALVQNAKETIERYKKLPRKCASPILNTKYKLTPDIVELRKKLQQKRALAGQLQRQLELDIKS